MVIVTAAEVVALPAASWARAESAWLLLATVAVLQASEKGGALISELRLAPSSRNWTPATPTSSVALAATVMVPETVTPGVGLVIDTAGGELSGMGVVALALADGADRLPAASRARTA